MNTLRLYTPSSALLLLLLPSLLLLLTLWPSGTSALPVRTGGCAQCSQLFRNLLLNVTDLLRSDTLCFGITSDKAVVKSQTETLLTCVPPMAQDSGCYLQRNSSFSERDCLRNIMKDLLYYEAAIKSYIRSPLRSPEEEVALLRPTLGVIARLKNCSLLEGESDEYSEDADQMWGSDTFTNRQEMCKMMRGFYVRAITINRAMGYISSGEHRK